jgi:hypothetical protein
MRSPFISFSVLEIKTILSQTIISEVFLNLSNSVCRGEPASFISNAHFSPAKTCYDDIFQYSANHVL